jgi:tRNA(Ile)-lysidine synthase
MIKNKILLKDYKNQRLALAVSGGVDSMAMLHLFNEFGVSFVVLTVDHGLREESGSEALYVKETCDTLSIKHVTLQWKHDGIYSNIHDKARDARYDLMTDWCKENNIDILCTAHHLDDRVEHFFIRVSRGAGLLGLLDHYEMDYKGIKVIRPLFDCSKSDLIDYLETRKIKWCEDKSNNDKKYLRTNIRKWLASMPKSLDPELFRKRVIGVKDNLKRAAFVINRLFDEVLRDDVEFFDDGNALIKSLPYDEEIAYMLISHILPIVSGENDPPRMSAMQILYDKMKAESFKRSTLCGCIIEKNKEGFFVKKE